MAGSTTKGSGPLSSTPRDVDPGNVSGTKSLDEKDVDRAVPESDFEYLARRYP